MNPGIGYYAAGSVHKSLLYDHLTGKKAYGEWSPEEVLHEILFDQYPSIEGLPALNIGIVLANFSL